MASWHPRLLVCGSVFLRRMAILSSFDKQDLIIEINCWRAQFIIRRSNLFSIFNLLFVRYFDRFFCGTLLNWSWCKYLLTLCGCVWSLFGKYLIEQASRPLNLKIINKPNLFLLLPVSHAHSKRVISKVSINYTFFGSEVENSYWPRHIGSE